jgi:transketolase
MFAGSKQVDNLILTIDHNGRQIDGDTDQVLPLGSIEAKFTAFGWDVLTLQKGNDLAAVIEALQNAKAKTGHKKPVLIVMHTEMGMGIDYMMGSHKWHGVAPNDEQLQAALQQLPSSLADY